MQHLVDLRPLVGFVVLKLVALRSFSFHVVIKYSLFFDVQMSFKNKKMSLCMSKKSHIKICFNNCFVYLPYTEATHQSD